MKKLIILTLLFAIAFCGCHPVSTRYIVVEEVHLLADNDYKYEVILRDDFGNFCYNAALLTNTLYQVGDTLK